MRGLSLLTNTHNLVPGEEEEKGGKFDSFWSFDSSGEESATCTGFTRGWRIDATVGVNLARFVETRANISGILV